MPDMDMRPRPMAETLMPLLPKVGCSIMWLLVEKWMSGALLPDVEEQQLAHRLSFDRLDAVERIRRLHEREHRVRQVGHGEEAMELVEGVMRPARADEARISGQVDRRAELRLRVVRRQAAEEGQHFRRIVRVRPAPTV